MNAVLQRATVKWRTGSISRIHGMRASTDGGTIRGRRPCNRQKLCLYAIISIIKPIIYVINPNMGAGHAVAEFPCQSAANFVLHPAAAP
jgi:hypothetical protein